MSDNNGSSSASGRGRSVSDTTLPQIHSWLDAPATSTAGGVDRHGRLRSPSVREGRDRDREYRERYGGGSVVEGEMGSPLSRSRQVAAAAPMSIRTRSP